MGGIRGIQGLGAPCTRKELQLQLVDLGNKLLTPPSHVSDLLSLLDKAESHLSKVEQSPSSSMLEALLPVMRALISEKLSGHPDMDVKVSTVACLAEIIRITAPNPPYNKDLMKEIFKLTVIAFEQLAHVSGRSYYKSISILKTLAEVRACLLMLGPEVVEFVVEIFKMFLKISRSTHPREVFSAMELLMTVAIEESEVISMELLIPLLDSVRNDNRSVSPRKLGKRVVKNSAEKLRTFIIEAIQSKGLVLDDYLPIVASICDNAVIEHSKKDPVLKERQKTNIKYKRGRTLETEEDLDEKLVGKKIKVWWPMDKAFYDGKVDSFDSVEKRHKVLYSDGDVEVLNLREERWKLVFDKSLLKDEADIPIPESSTDSLQEEKTETKSGLATKQAKSGSSKRSGGASSAKLEVESPKSNTSSMD